MLLTLRDFGIEGRQVVNLPVIDEKRRNRYSHFIRSGTDDENAEYFTRLSLKTWAIHKQQLTGYVAIVVYNLDGSFYLAHNLELGDPHGYIVERREADPCNLELLSDLLPRIENVEAYAVYQQIPSEAGTQRFRTVHTIPSDRVQNRY